MSPLKAAQLRDHVAVGGVLVAAKSPRQVVQLLVLAGVIPAHALGDRRGVRGVGGLAVELQEGGNERLAIAEPKLAFLKRGFDQVKLPPPPLPFRKLGTNLLMQRGNFGFRSDLSTEMLHRRC